ncbi:hypothetical protein BGZ75_007296 [Mortierella antarctica]|nr:hypothetical protein BGZ75_007296 [Mortierella antarctica]
MEIVDKQEVVLLDGLNPTALPPYTMIRTATAFESALQLHSSYPPGAPFTPEPVDGPPPADQPSQQKRFKNRLQKIIRIPPSVAQTHTRMTTIRLGISRVEKKKLASTSVTVHSPSTTPTPTTPTTDKLAFISSTPPSTTRGAQDGEEEASAPATPIPSPNALDSTERSYHLRTIDSLSSNTEQDSEEPDLMAPREGFTVSYSLFAKVKARVLNNQRSHQRQQQRHPLVKTRSTSDSGSSQLDDDAEQCKRASRERIEAEVESNSSDSNSNTLSAGTSGNLNKGLHLRNSLHHHHDIDAHNDPSNDSDSTVTEIEESVARLQQRKYDFENARLDNSTGTEVGALAAPALALTTASAISGCEPVSPHAEVIAEEQNEGFVLVTAITDPSADDCQGEDPVQLFEQVLHRQHMTEAAIAASLHELRQLILAYGIPEEPSTPGSRTTGPSIRSRCWKLLLEVHHISAQEYVSLVKQGKPEEYGKIRNDTFRTLATDRKFLDVVVEESLIRVLCAFAWSTQATSLQETGVSFTYVQGMNVLAAPFLYTMSEMEAFYSYSNFLKFCCPLYVQPTLQGVHCGIKLLERCLCMIDVELYDYLKSKKLSAELYAFPSVLTICACTPPLDQAMQLWDFLLAWGIHLNIICIIAQLHLNRKNLMSHASPMKLLRIFPDLDADKIIRETIRMVKLLPDDLYDLLVRHPYDPAVADQISW